MPADRFPVVFERGTVEIEVLFLGDILRVAVVICVREGIQASNYRTYRVQMGGWGLA